MLQLEVENVIIKSILNDKYVKPTSLDQQFVDFDGVRYHMTSTDKKTVLLLSMEWPCIAQLNAFGANELLSREYGSALLPADQTEQGYDLSLVINLEELPEDPEARTEKIRTYSLLKRNVLAAPFEGAFEAQKQLEANPPEPGMFKPDLMAIQYRPEEAIYISPGVDRVTVVFSTVFKEETDRVFGKVFLQEFADARKLPAIQAAPQVIYSLREPPLEIRHVPGLDTAENVGYVTFVLFPRHFANADKAWETISRIQLFRDYLHYHIKCSKAYMQSRMRHRVAEFLKVLNRAKPEAEKERKTATGRTFVRG